MRESNPIELPWLHERLDSGAICFRNLNILSLFKSWVETEDLLDKQWRLFIMKCGYVREKGNWRKLPMEVVFGEVGCCDIYIPTQSFITKSCSPKPPSHTHTCPFGLPGVGSYKVQVLLLTKSKLENGFHGVRVM